MATYIKTIKDNNGNFILPRTKSSAVNFESGETLETFKSTHTNDTDAHGLGNGTVNTMDLSFGANIIHHDSQVPIFPEIEFKGMHYTNLLGKDGNCEDLSKWTLAAGAFSLVTENKVFGNNCFKVNGGTANNYGDIFKPIPQFDKTKNYILSAYLLNFNSSGVRVRVFDTQSMLEVYVSSEIVDTSMRRHVARIPANTLTGTGEFTVEVVTIGDDSVYGFVDGIMLTEVPASDLALTDAQLLAKYPYIDSYGTLTNPYFENRRHNLVRNGNCEEGAAWWIPHNTDISVSVENDKFKLISTAAALVKQFIDVKPNTNYYLSANLSSANLTVRAYTMGNVVIKIGSGTFNTGDNNRIFVAIRSNIAETNYFDSVMLIEGSIAPTEYKSCDIQRFIIEDQFTSDDKVIIKDGKVSGWKNWGHRTLYGKDYDWQFSVDYAGIKRIRLTLLPAINQNFVAGGGNIEIKYDGKPLISGATTDGVADRFSGSTNNDINLITVADTESGWQETKNPNNDEVKAFMNGWKAVASTSTRYITWVSIVDGKLPTGFFNTTTTATSTNVNYVDVVDASGFVIGDAITTQNSGASWSDRTITNISGNRITLNANVTVALGAIITKADNGTTQLSMLEYCKNNIAPGYEGYRLHYKLANPEPIIPNNTNVKGTIWSIGSGDNYITIDSGIILDEVANAVFYNTNYYIGISDSSRANYSPLKYNDIGNTINVYKNNIIDNKWSYSTTVDINGYVYTSSANFDTSATYKVDYQILKTLHAQSFGNIVAKYNQSVYSAINTIAKAIENKTHDSNYKVGKNNFLSGSKSFIVRDAFITADTWIDIVPTQTKIGTWEVESYNGYFIITSDAIETSNVSFNWRGTK